MVAQEAYFLNIFNNNKKEIKKLEKKSLLF